MPLCTQRYEIPRPRIVLVKRHDHVGCDLRWCCRGTMHLLYLNFIVASNSVKGHSVKRSIIIPSEYTFKKDNVIRCRRLRAALINHSIYFLTFSLAHLSWQWHILKGIFDHFHVIVLSEGFLGHNWWSLVSSWSPSSGAKIGFNCPGATRTGLSLAWRYFKRLLSCLLLFFILM